MPQGLLREPKESFFNSEIFLSYDLKEILIKMKKKKNQLFNKEQRKQNWTVCEQGLSVSKYLMSVLCVSLILLSIVCKPLKQILGEKDHK